MSGGIVIDLATRRRAPARAASAPAYECGSVTCSGCGYQGTCAQRAGHVRLEVTCPVCHRAAPFESFAGIDGLPVAAS